MPVRQIHRTRVGAEVRGQKAEHVLAELFQTLFSLDPQAQSCLPRSEPCLGLSRAVVARHDHAGDRDQEDQQRRSTPRHSRRQRDRVLPFRLTTFERCSRLRLHLDDELSNSIHRRLAPVAQNEGERTRQISGAVQRDRFAQFADLLGDQPLERGESQLLVRIAGNQRVQPAHLNRNRGPCVAVRLEISLLPRQEKPPLAGLGILDARQERLELLQRLHRLRDAPDVLLAGARRQIGKQRNQKDGEGRNHEAGERQGRQHLSGPRGGRTGRRR